jgi:hypothetical protein
LLLCLVCYELSGRSALMNQGVQLNGVFFASSLGKERILSATNEASQTESGQVDAMQVSAR